MQGFSQFKRASEPYPSINSSSSAIEDFFPSPHSSISSASGNNSGIYAQQLPPQQQSVQQAAPQQQQQPQAPGSANANNSSNFNLPLELQGGVSNFFNRRPSYAADLINQASLDPLLQYQLGLNTRSNLYETSASLRTNSVDYSSFQNTTSANTNNNNRSSSIRSNPDFDPNYMHLDDGLLLNKATNTIVTSPDLKRQFNQCCNYFGDFDEAMKVVDQLNLLIGLPSTNISEDEEDPNLPILQERVRKLLDHLLNQNEDLKSSNHLINKNYSLILNKNGRLDIISFPKTSNLQPMPRDLIIIEGDRGKDLVMVLKPVIEFRFALFFNYLKKKLHLKSLEFGNSSSNPNDSPASASHNHHNNNHHNKNANNNNNNNGGNKSIINEDENFITLPNKQILRFAKPHELNQLISKYNDEVMAYRICLNYAASLNLSLIIKNVEFQFDKKKLIIYYYCLQRLDFRGLIKELFKIYKTRIWLCAILPLEKSKEPLLEYELEKRGQNINRINDNEKDDENQSNNNNNNNKSNREKAYRSNSNVVHDSLPNSEQIYQFNEVTEPIYFHCKIFGNLVEMFKYEISNLDSFKDSYWFLE